MRHNNCNGKQASCVDANDSNSEKKLVQSRLPFKVITAASGIANLGAENNNKRKICNGDVSDNAEDNNNSNQEINECNEAVPMNEAIAIDCSSSSSEHESVENGNNNETDCKPLVTIKLPGARKSKIKSVIKESKNNSDQNSVLGKMNPNKRMKLESVNSPEKSEKCDQECMETIELNSDSSNEALESKASGENESLDTASDSDHKMADISSNSVTNSELKPPSPSKDKKTVKLSEKRRKARDKKEVKLQEDREKASVEKEKREFLKKQERDKKIEEKKKEREEKEKQKRIEREEKEKKRLAELNAKTEEKRKRTEAREEELRKKEEERKRKEQEKDEAEFKKKKAAEGFKKFFVAKDLPTNTEDEHVLKENSSVSAKILAFRPFEIKGDMQLAPVCRKLISTESKLEIDSILESTKTQNTDADKNTETSNVIDKTAALYLSQLNTGLIIPMKWRKPSMDKKEIEEDDDVCIVDDLERAGQAIEENHSTFERHRAKFFKFHENRRPPYFGTWRKKTKVITPKRPFAKDEKFFDYDVDSDLDWEEEEPGESLDGSDDEKEKESEDDEYEVDNEWFVPHGHLSDEELQTEFENGLNNNNDREAQKVKLKIKQQEFAMQMKKKTEKLKPRLLGCIWVDENGNQPKDFSDLIWNTLNKRSMIFSTVCMDETEEVVSQETGSPTTINGTEKLKPIVLNDKLLKDLIRLIHGNSNSKSFLIKEYITYIETNENSVKNGGVRGPLKSMVREKIDEFAEWKVIEAASTDISKRTNKVKKRLCWIVADHVLKHMDMEELTLHNNWQYILQPKLSTKVSSKES